MMEDRPDVSNVYWVLPGRFMAGEYPGGFEDTETQLRLHWLLQKGIDFILDLTEEGEYRLKPYKELLDIEAGEQNREVSHRRIPIPDMSTPSPEIMSSILDTIDEALASGHNLYVHCYGGKGRTGTVVGCYLARLGMDGGEALLEIARLREGTPNAKSASPETTAQCEMVRNWPTGK